MAYARKRFERLVADLGGQARALLARVRTSGAADSGK
jgi:hypothetical protein